MNLRLEHASVGGSCNAMLILLALRFSLEVNEDGNSLNEVETGYALAIFAVAGFGCRWEHYSHEVPSVSAQDNSFFKMPSTD